MSPVSRNHELPLQPGVLAATEVTTGMPEPLPRRSFLTGRVLDPELHPPLRRRLARALGRR